jgi:hypothetical protein
MESDGRVSASQHRHHAARWRQLAAEATTPFARNHLLKLAQQCEFLAGGSLGVGTARDQPEEPGLLGAPQ